MDKSIARFESRPGNSTEMTSRDALRMARQYEATTGKDAAGNFQGITRDWYKTFTGAGAPKPGEPQLPRQAGAAGQTVGGGGGGYPPPRTDPYDGGQLGDPGVGLIGGIPGPVRPPVAAYPPPTVAPGTVAEPGLGGLPGPAPSPITGAQGAVHNQGFLNQHPGWGAKHPYQAKTLDYSLNGPRPRGLMGLAGRQGR